VADPPRYRDKPETIRRWVKALVIAAIVVLLIVVVMMVAGGGDHGPSRHKGGDTPSSDVHTPPFQHQ
jgi:hypothetical protein